MLPQIIKNIFGTRNSRLLKEYEPFIKKINNLEKKYEDLDVSNFINETSYNTTDIGSILHNTCINENYYSNT